MQTVKYKKYLELINLQMTLKLNVKHKKCLERQDGMQKQVNQEA